MKFGDLRKMAPKTRGVYKAKDKGGWTRPDRRKLRPKKRRSK